MSRGMLIVAWSIATCTVFGSATNAQTVLSVDPAAQSVSVGSDFTVAVNVSNVSDLYGYQFDLIFNPQVISAVSSSEGSFLTTAGSTYFVPGTNDNLDGAVSATADTVISAVPGATGSGNLVVFTFDALKAGVSSLDISGVYLLDSGFNSIDSTATSASVTVAASGSGTMAAPEIDPASTVSALTLLLGGFAAARGRRMRQGVTNRLGLRK